MRAFSDLERSRLRNHVLFASDANLAAVNLTAALAAVEARAATMQAAAAGAGSSGSTAQQAGPAGGSSTDGQQSGQPLEVLDPLQLQVWRALPRQEVHLTYDRQRCQQLLEREGEPVGRSSGSSSNESGGSSGSPSGSSGEEVEQRPPSLEQLAAGKLAKKAPLGKLGQAQQAQRAKQAQRGGGQRPPWVWRKMKEMRERHALAVGHWVAMRTGWSDAFWQD